MEKLNISPQPEVNLTAAVANKPPVQTISYTKALIIFIVTLMVIGSGGYALGKYKFWRTYDTTPRLDREESLWLERANADTNNPDNYVELGWVYFQKKQYDKAESAYKKALALDDKNYKAHMNLGITYQQEQKDDRAITELEKAIEIAPKAQAAHLSLGQLYFAKANWAKADSELEAAYKANPGDAEVLYKLGVTKEKLGKKSDAIDVYRQVLSFMPEQQDAKGALARLTAKK